MNHAHFVSSPEHQTDSPNTNLPNAQPVFCPVSCVTAVSAVRQAEDELDDAIRDLKTLAALAEDAGQIETAIDYTRRSLAASRSRTPEHKDRLAREQLARAEAQA